MYSRSLSSTCAANFASGVSARCSNSRRNARSIGTLFVASSGTRRIGAPAAKICERAEREDARAMARVGQAPSEVFRGGFAFGRPRGLRQLDAGQRVGDI